MCFRRPYRREHLGVNHRIPCGPLIRHFPEHVGLRLKPGNHLLASRRLRQRPLSLSLPIVPLTLNGLMRLLHNLKLLLHALPLLLPCGALFLPLAFLFVLPRLSVLEPRLPFSRFRS